MIKTAHKILWTILLCLQAVPAFAVPPLTLTDAYHRALETSESLKLTESDVQLAEIRYRQAIAAAFPEIDANLEERVRNSAESSSQNSGSGNRNFGEGSKDQFEGFFSLHQPIFRGFREFILADAARAEGRAAELNVTRSRELILKDVADIFYQILLYERDLDELSRTERILKDRRAELVKYQSLGKSRDSELQAADADISALLASIERGRGLLAESRELLAFLTGLPATEIAVQERDLFGPEAPLAEYLERGQSRSDLQGLAELKNSADIQLKAASRERWPSVSLDGNAYVIEDPSNERDWDLTLNLQVPVFDGGRISSRISERELESSRSALRVAEGRRIAEREIRVSYSNLKAAQATAEKVQSLVANSEKSYQSQRADYELGVVNNLTVLESIRQLQAARRQLLSALVDSSRFRVALEVAAGGPQL